MPTNDPLFGKGAIRADGRKIHPAYLFEVKKPADSKYPWDYYNVVATIPAGEAFIPAGEERLPDAEEELSPFTTGYSSCRPCAGHPRSFLSVSAEDVDGRDKPGHDEIVAISLSSFP